LATAPLSWANESPYVDNNLAKAYNCEFNKNALGVDSSRNIYPPYTMPTENGRIAEANRILGITANAGDYSVPSDPFTPVYKNVTAGETFDGVWNREFKSALDHQVGGSGHYKDTEIQPIEFIAKNNLSFIVGNCIKYVVRAEKKGGSEDIRKAIHYLQLELELKYGVRSEIEYAK